MHRNPLTHTFLLDYPLHNACKVCHIGTNCVEKKNVIIQKWTLSGKTQGSASPSSFSSSSSSAYALNPVSKCSPFCPFHLLLPITGPQATRGSHGTPTGRVGGQRQVRACLPALPKKTTFPFPPISLSLSLQNLQAWQGLVHMAAE